MGKKSTQVLEQKNYQITQEASPPQKVDVSVVTTNGNGVIHPWSLTVDQLQSLDVQPINIKTLSMCSLVGDI